MTLEVVDKSQENNCENELFTREGTLPVDKRGMKQTLHIEGLLLLDPLNRMIQFFDQFINKLISSESALRGGDAHGIRIAPASQSIAVCLKVADPILSFSLVQISPFFSGIKTSA